MLEIANKNVSFQPDPGEKIILEEDCAEDKLKSGILILTSKRLVFVNTVGKLATLSKKEGEVVLDLPLDKINSVKGQGFFIAKLLVSTGDNIYKFGVFGIGKWEKEFQKVKAGAS